MKLDVALVVYLINFKIVIHSLRTIKMGLIINLWPNYDIVGSYDPSGYQAAFALMLAIQLAGLAWFFFFRKTKV